MVKHIHQQQGNAPACARCRGLLLLTLAKCQAGPAAQAYVYSRTIAPALRQCCLVSLQEVKLGKLGRCDPVADDGCCAHMMQGPGQIRGQPGPDGAMQGRGVYI